MGDARIGRIQECSTGNKFETCQGCGRFVRHIEPAKGGYAHYPNNDVYDRFMCGTFSATVERCPSCQLCVEDDDHEAHSSRPRAGRR